MREATRKRTEKHKILMEHRRKKYAETPTGTWLIKHEGANRRTRRAHLRAYKKGMAVLRTEPGTEVDKGRDTVADTRDTAATGGQFNIRDHT